MMRNTDLVETLDTRNSKCKWYECLGLEYSGSQSRKPVLSQPDFHFWRRVVDNDPCIYTKKLCTGWPDEGVDSGS